MTNRPLEFVCEKLNSTGQCAVFKNHTSDDGLKKCYLSSFGVRITSSGGMYLSCRARRISGPNFSSDI